MRDFLQAVCVLWLGLLFRALGSTAEGFFSPILTQLSQEMGLPPRLAGGEPPCSSLHACSVAAAGTNGIHSMILASRKHALYRAQTPSPLSGANRQNYALLLQPRSSTCGVPHPQTTLREGVRCAMQ